MMDRLTYRSRVRIRFGLELGFKIKDTKHEINLYCLSKERTGMDRRSAMREGISHGQ